MRGKWVSTTNEAHPCGSRQRGTEVSLFESVVLSDLSSLLELFCSVCSSDVESKTLQGIKGELDLDRSGQHHLENTTLDFQKLSDKEVLRITGPLGADFTVKVREQIYQFEWAEAALINTVISKMSYGRVSVVNIQILTKTVNRRWRNNSLTLRHLCVWNTY